MQNRFVPNTWIAVFVVLVLLVIFFAWKRHSNFSERRDQTVKGEISGRARLAVQETVPPESDIVTTAELYSNRGINSLNDQGNLSVTLPYSGYSYTYLTISGSNYNSGVLTTNPSNITLNLYPGLSTAGTGQATFSAPAPVYMATLTQTSPASLFTATLTSSAPNSLPSSDSVSVDGFLVNSLVAEMNVPPFYPNQNAYLQSTAELNNGPLVLSANITSSVSTAYTITVTNAPTVQVSSVSGSPTQYQILPTPDLSSLSSSPVVNFQVISPLSAWTRSWEFSPGLIQSFSVNGTLFNSTSVPVAFGSPIKISVNLYNGTNAVFPLSSITGVSIRVPPDVPVITGKTGFVSAADSLPPSWVAQNNQLTFSNLKYYLIPGFSLQFSLTDQASGTAYTVSSVFQPITLST